MNKIILKEKDFVRCNYPLISDGDNIRTISSIELWKSEEHWSNIKKKMAINFYFSSSTILCFSNTDIFKNSKTSKRIWVEKIPFPKSQKLKKRENFPIKIKRITYRKSVRTDNIGHGYSTKFVFSLFTSATLFPFMYSVIFMRNERQIERWIKWLLV